MNQLINEQLRNHIKDYVTFMVNPIYKNSDYSYCGYDTINFLKSYIDEHKQEIDIKALKEYLNVFDIIIFNEDILNIEKQLSSKKPKTFEEDLELLFKEKIFTSYATNIYNIPEIATNRLEKLLKKYNQPIEQLVDNNLLARLANTTTTTLIEYWETDGYQYQSKYNTGVNFLAFEIIKKFLQNTSEIIKDIKIGNNKPFENSIILQKNQKFHVEKDNDSKTLFQILSQIINLYHNFQRGGCYSFSENYYSNGLGVLNLCLNKMTIKPKLIEELNSPLNGIHKLIKENKDLNTYQLENINEQYLAICKTLKITIQNKTFSMKKF